MHKKLIAIVMAGLGLAATGVGYAEQGNILIRARAVNLDWDNKNQDGLQNPVGKVEAEKRWIPEVDLSYFLTKNLAAELVLTYPQQVDIKTAALGRIGHVDALPPSLVLQYHFTDLGAFKPYVGLGINYTLFTKKSFDTALGKVSVDRSTTGWVGQVGADIVLDKNWLINVDAKYIQMDSDVKLNGNKLGKLGLNPLTYGVGVGYRF